MSWTPRDIINLIIALTGLLGVILGGIAKYESGLNTKSILATDHTINSIVENVGEK